MSTPTTVAEERHTGRDVLAQAVVHEDLPRRNRLVWDTIGSAENHASRPASALFAALASVGFRDDVDPELRETLHRQMPAHAQEVFRAFQRGVSICPLTLTAMSRGVQSPVHGTERARITSSVARKMVVLGFDVDDNIARLVTYAAAGDVTEALTHEV